MHDGYTDASGARHEWMAPAELGRVAPLLCLAGTAEEHAAARAGRALGTVPPDPAGRYMFLPEMDPRHFGYFVDAPAPDPPTYEHVLFHVRALRRQTQREQPDWTPEAFRTAVAATFFADCGLAEQLADDVLLLEELIVSRRVCMARSAERIWADIDGGDSAVAAQLRDAPLDRLRRIGKLSANSRWVADMVRSARALVQLANA